MEKIITEIDGLALIKPPVFKDDRGVFFESFNHNKFSGLFPQTNFVQDNLSISHKNVLRGLHFQLPPFDQGKLVQVLKGSVLDVAVDLRRKSSTFGKHFQVVLTDINRLQFWIPPGFAHGFLSLEENTIFSYKCTNNYSPEHEETICWNDKDLGINWGETAVIVSAKDQQGTPFRLFNTPF